MSPSGIHYFPVAAPALLGLTILFVVVAGFVATRLLTFASASMGLAPHTMIAVLLISLLGSYINIPVAQLPERHMTSAAIVTYYGIPYVVPLVRASPGTILAINVGGAVIPTVLSLYLMVRNQLFRLSLWGIGVVALACYLLATPEPGLGIAEPVFVPCVVTTITALSLSRRHAGALAYICGSLGTLIGADLLNLGKIRGLGAPIASIGGAGTFDGIFVIGLLSVVYAGWFASREARRRGG
ncbi:MAG TPA: DUF1614 domain-containing protein [Steroidobacteraceae bacterium]|nr:DUF1614 domain-containing protein [Steroidobacteraceae bacterium]